MRGREILLVIEQINAKKLLIVLEEKDMDELGLTYESISWSNQKSREIMAKLLTLAKIETGFSIENYKLSIETLPQFNGCIIIFTLASDSYKENIVESNKTYLNKAKSNTMIYKFDNLDDILKICKQLYNLYESETYKSDVYTYKNEYYLVIHTYEEIKKPVYIMLSEYGEMLKQNKIFISYLDEYGDIIKKDDAVVSIGKYM